MWLTLYGAFTPNGFICWPDKICIKCVEIIKPTYTLGWWNVEVEKIDTTLPLSPQNLIITSNRRTILDFE